MWRHGVSHMSRYVTYKAYPSQKEGSGRQPNIDVAFSDEEREQQVHALVSQSDAGLTYEELCVSLKESVTYCHKLGFPRTSQLHQDILHQLPDLLVSLVQQGYLVTK